MATASSDDGQNDQMCVPTLAENDASPIEMAMDKFFDQCELEASIPSKVEKFSEGIYISWIF